MPSALPRALAFATTQAWVVANAKARGKALGINGVFGTAGIAATPLLAGALTAAFGWRYAFIVPGAVILLTGLAFLFVIRKLGSGAATDRDSYDIAVSRNQAIRGLAILSVTVLCVGLLAQACASNPTQSTVTDKIASPRIA